MADLKEAPKPKTQNGPGPMKDLAPRASAVPTKANGIPLAFVRRFAGEIDRLFEDFGFETGLHMPRFLSRGHELLRREAGLIPAEWSPRVDVLESEGRFVVRADLPGLTKEDVTVEVKDNLLMIQGERKQEKKEQGEGYNYSECSLRHVLPRHSAAGGFRGFEGDRGLPEGRPGDRRAGARACGTEGQAVGDPGREMRLPPRSSTETCDHDGRVARPRSA